ncbi:hypothetical protein [Almyronema epifaneia]|uniref:Uncharacterized protein n=1 Tax=Almyronema epifaneia S1 TaxID=2991925 RepID=A0ABW6IIG2_9CYAN
MSPYAIDLRDAVHEPTHCRQRVINDQTTLRRLKLLENREAAPLEAT